MSDVDNGNAKQADAVVPLFLRKLWKIVNDEENLEVISWNSTGDGFFIHDPVSFTTNLLPRYFKHSNLASFVRQLNFYDFHKVISLEKDEMQFAHTYFMKDLPQLLAFISRKGSSKTKTAKEDSPNAEEVQSLLNGVKELKGRHNLINKELEGLKEENSALWNEINCLRVKYTKQTKIINKLIHFLISYMHSHQNVFHKPNAGVSSKRLAKNLNAGPSLLEIGYRGRQKNTNKNSLPFILNQPSSSSAITYQMEPESEDENMDLLNSILEATNECGPAYSVQFPKSPRAKSPVNFEVVEKEIPDILQAAVDSNQCQAKKLVQIDKSGMLEDIFQTKDSANNKAITYSIKYPKLNGPTKAKPVVTAKPAKKSKINIVGNHTIVGPKPGLPVAPNSGQRTVQKVAVSSEVKDNSAKKNMVKPITMKGNQPKKFTIKKRPIKDKSTNSPAKQPKISNSTEVVEQQVPSSPIIDLTSDEFLSIPNILNDMNTIPAPSKTLDMSIRDNPKENLGVYVDNTQSKINDIQNVLTCNSKEWDNFLQNLSPMDEIEVQELLNAEENYNVDEMNKDLSEALEELPVVAEEIAGAQTNHGAVTVTDGANQENLLDVDVYFNNAFQI